MYDEIGFQIVCEKGIPRNFITEHKRKRVDDCQRLLDRYNNENEEFLSGIVIGNKNLGPSLKDSIWSGSTS